MISLPTRLSRWRPQFQAAELCYGVPVLLTAAICDRETNGGDASTPKGPEGTGDGGHGKGLMQIDDRFHHRFIVARFDDDMELWKDAAFNILYGAKLLARVHNLTNSWPVAICAYNAGAAKATRIAKTHVASSQEELIRALDVVTTKGNYVSDVLKRMASFGEAA